LGYLGLAAASGRDDAAGIRGIVQETQAFAKRQATWFRNQLPEAPHWDPDAAPLEAAFEKLGIP
jgi:tRNA dimethylallyltransferase